MIDYKIVAVVMFFVILVSIQYTLNLILKELRELKKAYRLDKDFLEKRKKQS